MSRRRRINVFLVSGLGIAAIFIPVRYDSEAKEFVDEAACGRMSCVTRPGMDCWVMPDQVEPVHDACDRRDCPSSWP